MVPTKSADANGALLRAVAWGDSGRTTSPRPVSPPPALALAGPAPVALELRIRHGEVEAVGLHRAARAGRPGPGLILDAANEERRRP